MAYYRCGGANHYDEGYSAGDSAGYTAGFNKGKTDQQNSGYTDGTFSLHDTRGDVWNDIVTIPGISRIDAIVSASLTDLEGGRHGFKGVYVVGTNTVQYDISGAFATGWDISITCRQYHARD